MQPNAEVLAEIHRALAAGKLIAAIKVYRAATRVGLKEAKDAVERIAAARSPAPVAPRSAPAIADRQIAALVAAGQRIEAIKLHRQTTGLGLEESRDAIVALEQRISPATVVRRSGGIGFLAIVALLTAAAVALAYVAGGFGR